MKIGVFGDSYADVNFNKPESCWPFIVSQSLEADADYYAKSGTSLWWAYEQFKKHYKKYDVIIFCLTSANRWPYLPDDFLGNHWNIGFKKENSLLDEINPHFFTIFSKNLLSFLNTEIHKKIVEICNNDNKYLVQVIPFTLFTRGFEIVPNRFPMIVGLADVSRLEEIFYDNKQQNTCDLLYKMKIVDYRCCHLNEQNNNTLADLVVTLIKEKKLDFRHDCNSNMSIWTKFDTNFKGLL